MITMVRARVTMVMIQDVPTVMADNRLSDSCIRISCFTILLVFIPGVV